MSYFSSHSGVVGFPVEAVQKKRSIFLFTRRIFPILVSGVQPEGSFASREQRDVMLSRVGIIVVFSRFLKSFPWFVTGLLVFHSAARDTL